MIDLRCGDCLEVMRDMEAQSVHCCVTSPPYWGLRDYGVNGQLGLEQTPEQYVEKIVAVFAEVRRVLRDDGTLWLNLGDSYNANQGAGFNGQKRQDEANRSTIMNRPAWLKPKDLVGIPWMVAFALRADGWYLRSDIIWAKPNPMPESVTDRPTKAHEYLFLLSKKPRYYYDGEAIREPDVARPQRHISNKQDVWTIPTKPFKRWQQTSRLVRVAPDASCDGKTHIVSGDCPVHAGLFVLLAMALGGGREACLSARTEHIGKNLAQERANDFGTIDSLLAYCFGGKSLDSWTRECDLFATDRSNQIHKMVHDLVTTWPCKPSARMRSHIEHTLASHGLTEHLRSIFANNTWPDELDAHLLDQTLHRRIDSSSLNGSCSCPAYQLTTEKTSHFATFPEKLVGPCILAGCPEEGTVLDPFMGSGTTGKVAQQFGRSFIGIELNPDYLAMAESRFEQQRLFN